MASVRVIGLALMLVGLLLMAAAFAAALLSLPSAATADESGLDPLEAALKRLEDSGVNVPLLLLCAAFALFAALLPRP